MQKRRGFMAFTAASVAMCTIGFLPTVSHAAEIGPRGGNGSYAARNGLTANDVRSINALNEAALNLGQPGRPSPSTSSPFGALGDDRVTPPAEPLNLLPSPYRAFNGRASTGVSNYIRKWQQVYSQRDGKMQQMTEQQREELSYGCVGVTWVNSGSYPTNNLAFASFDETKYKNSLANSTRRPGETQAEFEGRIAKSSFDEKKGFERARNVTATINKALENAHSETDYLTNLKADLTSKGDALANQDSRSNFYSALRNTASFKDKNGGNFDPSKMKAVIYSKHFWSGQDPWSSPEKSKFGDPNGFRPDRATGLVDMSQDWNMSRSAVKEGDAYVNFDYGWFGDQTETDANKTIWTHANHYNSPGGDMGPMDVYESTFPNWASGYEDFDRGAYMVVFIPKSWNTAPAKVKEGWQ
ncbi:protein-glutamine gamma-glutamyltransferase [Streptomyces sp. NRRL F-2664]|uniref:protein-glutamine gamma-glutamyltransferase n=1 Tax=Streptomyces sp. NRRL F-2664 TaxID=1463842 RepID=UPI0004C9CA57|nr:protein-glutamine gamma-glutamyltransferase [Streptomyces sp. NRRL F-2664]